MCIDSLVGDSILDEYIYTPIVTFWGLVIEFAILGRNHTQYFALHICVASFGKELADMGGDAFDIVLQALHILEDIVVDALEEIRLATLNC